MNGIPSPASDVDICLVLAHSDKPFRERAADYLPLGFPVGLDLFPYTRAELERLRRDHPSWHRALTAGVDLLPQAREALPRVAERRSGSIAIGCTLS